jgi:hypothetical protein
MNKISPDWRDFEMAATLATMRQLVNITLMNLRIRPADPEVNTLS